MYLVGFIIFLVILFSIASLTYSRQGRLPLILIFLGPPGSGKGTQAQKIAEAKKIPHISTGEMIRKQIEEQTALGLQAKEIVESGAYVSDDLIIEMLLERIAYKDCQEGYLLDGFPRTIHQAEALLSRFKKEIKLKVVNFKIEENVLLERLTGRLTCRACGAISHKIFSPPLQEGVCNRCGGDLYQRADDQVESVQQRLKVYEEKTAPLVEYFKERKMLLEVDASKSPETVFLEIEELIRR